MKKFMLTAAACLFMFGAAYGAPAEDDETPRVFNVKADAAAVTGSASGADTASEAPAKKEKIIQAGALEKIEGDRYILRKIQTRLDFYVTDATKFFTKSDGSINDLNDRCYVDLRGPRNKKAILANTIYIYPDKKTYDDMVDKETSAAAASGKKTFSAPLTGVVKQKEPLIIVTDDRTEYLVCPDEDTVWQNNKPADKSEMIAGDRIKTYFDKRLSVRYKSEAVKVVIDKSKQGL